MSDSKIFVVTHKKVKFPNELDDCYIPIQVGIGEDLSNYARENTPNSDNIAHKNASFCELTVLYYIWKNIKSDVVGLVHYRRYFTKRHGFIGYLINKGKHVLKQDKNMSAKHYIINQKQIDEIISTHDLIIPNPYRLPKNQSVYEDYIQTHHKKDWLLIQEIILQKYPDYYQCFNLVAESDSFIPCNAFIGKKQVISEYCEWLFDILFELEQRINLEEYDDYNKRVFGFLSERLFTVWIEKNQKKFRFYNLDLTFYNC